MSRPKGGSDNGLVYSVSSDTQVIHEVDTIGGRLKKMQCSTITSARLMQEQLARDSKRTFPVMVTLTYRPCQLWHPWHISGFLKIAREWFRRRKQSFHYVWVAELQERGAVHYHIIIWMPSGYHIPKPDKSGWWRYGMSEIKAARNAVGYLAKYASKGDRYDSFPKGLRMHGSGGLSKACKVEKRWWAAPGWVRQWLPEISDVKRMTGGGFVCLDTGEWRASPWNIFFEQGRIFIVKNLSESFKKETGSV